MENMVLTALQLNVLARLSIRIFLFELFQANWALSTFSAQETAVREVLGHAVNTTSSCACIEVSSKISIFISIVELIKGSL